MKRGKRPLTRKGRALRWLVLVVGLVMLVHLAAESRLLPSWVRTIAEDEYAAGHTEQVASLGTLSGRWGERSYLSAGEEALLFYSADFDPWRLGWSLDSSTSLDLTEEKALHVSAYCRLTGFEEPPHVFTYRLTCFGRVEAPEAETFVLRGRDYPGDGSPPEDVPGEELARFGRESCYHRDGHTYFAYTYEAARRDEPRQLLWLEVYDAGGELLCLGDTGYLL